MIKKLFSFILLLTITVSLCACGEEQTPETPAEGNVITAYFDKGYTTNGTCVEDGMLILRFVSPDKTDFVRTEVKLTKKELDTYEALDFFDENYEKNERAFFASVSGKIKVTDMNDMVPPREELEALVGKTASELEALGYDQSSAYSDEDENLVFVYSTEAYNLDIIFEGNYTALFDLADVDFASLKVQSVTFASFNE